MRELVRTNDIVLVSAIGALLDGANIHHLVLDQNMSVIEGSLGVLPRRILVHEDDDREARQLLSDAGLAHVPVEGDSRGLKDARGGGGELGADPVPGDQCDAMRHAFQAR